ncbi:hypothetical protein LI107_19110, partial [Blautia obeum]|uniref:hypothetical protein n=1 Tax=Blautia obeum TaxID=40520 RepID=UPI001D081FE7
RKGGTIYSYHLSLQQMNSFDHYSVPTDLRISSNLFYQLQNKHNATMTVRQGWLKYPWIQQIHPN